jgi:hypothetical protein
VGEHDLLSSKGAIGNPSHFVFLWRGILSLWPWFEECCTVSKQSMFTGQLTGDESTKYPWKGNQERFPFQRNPHGHHHLPRNHHKEGHTLMARGAHGTPAPKETQHHHKRIELFTARSQCNHTWKPYPLSPRFEGFNHQSNRGHVVEKDTKRWKPLYLTHEIVVIDQIYLKG